MSYEQPCNFWSVMDSVQRCKEEGLLSLLSVRGDATYPWVEIITAKAGSTLPDIDAMNRMQWPEYQAETARHPGVKVGSSFPLEGIGPCFDCPRCDALKGHNVMPLESRYRYLRADVEKALARIMAECRHEDGEEIRSALAQWLATEEWPIQRSQHDSIEAAMRERRQSGGGI